MAMAGYGWLRRAVASQLARPGFAVIAAVADAELEVQRSACLALCAMVVGSGDGQAKAGALGAVAAIAAAMLLRAGDETMQHICFHTLQNLTEDDAANRTRPDADAAVKAIVDAMEKWPVPSSCSV